MTKQEILKKLPHRAVIILQGAPGAGKSTFVTDLENHLGNPMTEDLQVCSADYYFVDDDGEYRFNPHLLKQAHASCWDNFNYWVNKKGNKRPLYLVVDNTNTTIDEMSRYITSAKENDWDVVIVTFVTEPATCHSRCLHGIPLDKIQKMWDKVMDCRLPQNVTRYIVREGLMD